MIVGLSYAVKTTLLGIISDWLHVQEVATPFLYVQGVALPPF